MQKALSPIFRTEKGGEREGGRKRGGKRRRKRMRQKRRKRNGIGRCRE
jgi:hypothetical protein